MHLEAAEIHIHRWELPTIEIRAHVQAGFGWRIAHEQDDVGVYFVARRRPILGSLAGGVFTVTAPHLTHLILRLEHCRLWANDISGQLEFPASVPIRPALRDRI
jgi:hypothetical protein